MLRRESRSRRRKSRRAHASLHLESLEPRHVLSGGAAGALVSPDWFADYTAGDTPRHAGPASLSWRILASDGQINVSAETNVHDWVVQFNTAALAGLASAAQTAGLLTGAGIQFEVLRGLGLQGQVLLRSRGASAATVAARLSADADVEGYQLDGFRRLQAVPGDTDFSRLWGLSNAGQSGGTSGADIQAPDAWGISTGSRNVVVAVIDTGVDYSHPDLAANIWTNTREIAGNGRDDDGNGFVDDARGFNFYSDTGNPMDDNGHGTHVAGTIGGVGNNGRGVAGVNWSVSLMSLKFLGADGGGYTSDAIRSINYVTMMRTQYDVNVRVINASWGGTGPDSELQRAIRAAGDAGILFVAAAGNTGTNNDASPTYPANADAANLLSVAATDGSDRLATFSCYGATTVDLGAPGTSIYSTLPGNRYGYMQGTSMATPHVAGVAALAWSVTPNATVAQIRDAILRGVEQVPGLAGKVASGGRLNAYNTLRLLQPSASPTPVVASLLATPSAIEAGRSLTLTAQGVAEPGGTITGVYFYHDSNANGQWDSADRLLGSTATITSGRAARSVSTAGMATGNHRLFARALDGEGRWSAAASTMLTVIAADDHGNSAATATLLSAGMTIRANMTDEDDADWFKFQAVAGKTYVFQTSLNTLYDSVLALYGSDGQTLVAMNDDLASGNYASRITWRAPSAGTYYVAVAPYPASGGGTYSLSMSGANTAPVLAPLSNRAMTAGGSLTLRLAATDADGDALRYSVRAKMSDPVAQRAYNLDQQLGLARNTRYRNNARGWQERYLTGTGGNTYFIVPNGTLYRLVNAKNIRQSTVVGRLASAYHANPALLYNAARPSMVPAAANLVAVKLSGNVLTVRPTTSFTGQVQVVATVTDGSAAVSRAFTVTVSAPRAASRAATPAPKAAPPRSSAPAANPAPNWWRRFAGASSALRPQSVDTVLAAGAQPRTAAQPTWEVLALDVLRRARAVGRG